MARSNSPFIAVAQRYGAPGLTSAISLQGERLRYNDGTRDSSNIEIAGDYWPSFRVCKDMKILKAIAHEFFTSGQPSKSEHWIHFSDEE